MKTWDEFFMEMAWLVSTKSKDDSTKVGCVLVRGHDFLTMGFNGFPRDVKEVRTVVDTVPFELGMVYPEGSERIGLEVQIPSKKLIDERWHQRPEKYLWVEHAERNAVYNAARLGLSTIGATAYITYGTPCSDCARALIQAGVKEVVGTDIPFPGKGAGEFYQLSDDTESVPSIMLAEAGVERRMIQWAHRMVADE